MPYNDLRVSVVMSVYNAESYLAQALRSVLEQDIENYEVVVVDDGSSDKSSEILRTFACERLVVLEQDNRGLAKALNRGIRNARAPLIARMDADDRSTPNRLRLQLQFLERNRDHVAVGSNARVIDKEGGYVYTTERPLEDERLRARLPETPFIHSTTVFRKEVFYAAGEYCDQMVVAQDTVLFNRMARLGRLANLAPPLLEYRIVPSANSAREKKSAAFTRILHKAIEDNAISEEEAAYVAQRTKDRESPRRLVNYHNFLAKKFLWNNFRPDEARRHLRKSCQVQVNVNAVALYVLSCLPGVLLQQLYRAAKRGQS